jgi:hypothetical protein
MSMGMKIQEVAESFLSPVSLRLTKEDERERFDQLLKTKHYLQSARIGGSHLRYFAEVGGDPDIQRRGPAFEASGKMGGLPVGDDFQNTLWRGVAAIDAGENAFQRIDTLHTSF